MSSFRAMTATSPPTTAPLTDPQPRDVIALHTQVQSLVEYVNSMHGTEARINGLIYDGTNSLRTDLSAVQDALRVLTAQYAHFLTTPPNVIHIDAPQRTGGTTAISVHDLLWILRDLSKWNHLRVRVGTGGRISLLR